jgi:predicted nucleic acid-binding protein
LRRFVLDASIALSWFIDPSVAPVAAKAQGYLARGDRAIVPHLWWAEVANGFVIAQKRAILAPARLAQAFNELDLIRSQSIDAFEHDFSIQRIVTSAQRFDLTAYDATYLEVANELRLPLATLDRKLSAAAAQAGIDLVS